MTRVFSVLLTSSHREGFIFILVLALVANMVLNHRHHHDQHLNMTLDVAEALTQCWSLNLKPKSIFFQEVRLPTMGESENVGSERKWIRPDLPSRCTYKLGVTDPADSPHTCMKTWVRNPTFKYFSAALYENKLQLVCLPGKGSVLF